MASGAGRHGPCHAISEFDRGLRDAERVRTFSRSGWSSARSSRSICACSGSSAAFRFPRLPIRCRASPRPASIARRSSGFLLFSVRPLTYAENPAFLIKISLVALGVMNALVLRTTWGWQMALDDQPIPDSVRAAAFRSLLIWAGAVFAGRWIGFLQ